MSPRRPQFATPWTNRGQERPCVRAPLTPRNLRPNRSSLRVEIGCADADDRSRSRLGRLRGRLARTFSRRGLGPNAEYASAVRGQPFVIAEKDIVALERLVRPHIIRKC